MKNSFKYAAATAAAITAITKASLVYATNSPVRYSQDSAVPGNVATWKDTSPNKASTQVNEKTDNDRKVKDEKNRDSKHSKDKNRQTDKNSMGN